jgi:hypothetical protein
MHTFTFRARQLQHPYSCETYARQCKAVDPMNAELTVKARLQRLWVFCIPEDRW